MPVLLSSPLAPAETCQTQQAKARQILIAHPAIVGDPAAFEFHRPQPAPEPSVQQPKLFATGAPPGGKVLRCAPDDLVEFRDGCGIEVVTTDGHAPHFLLKFLHLLGSHPPRARREPKAQEGITLAILRTSLISVAVRAKGDTRFSKRRQVRAKEE